MFLIVLGILSSLPYAMAFHAEDDYFQPPNPNSSLREIRNALDQAISNSDPSQMAEVYTSISQYLAENPQSTSAQGLLLRAESSIEGINDIHQRALAFRKTGSTFYRNQEWGKAMEANLNVLSIARSVADDSLASRAHYSIALIFYQIREYSKAIEYYSLALQNAQALGDSTHQAQIAWGIGLSHQMNGNFLKAIEYYTLEESLIENIPDLNWLANTYNRLAIAHEQMGSYQTAELYFKKALTIYHTLGSKEKESNMAKNLGDLYNQIGDQEQALAYLYQSLKLSKDSDSPLKQGIVQFALAELYNAKGQPDSAIYFYQNCIETLEVGVQDQYTQERLLNSYKGIAEAYSQIGNYQYALFFEKKYSSHQSELEKDPSRDIVIQLENDYKIKQAQEIAEAAQAELEATKADLKTEINNRITWALGGGAFAMMIVVMVLLLQRQVFFQNLMARIRFRS